MTVAELNAPWKATPAAVAFRHILVATDFSIPSQRAWLEALALSTENQATLSLVHVLHADRHKAAPEDPAKTDLERQAAEKQIKPLLDQARPEHQIEIILLKHGPMVNQIVSLIEDRTIDLLILGTRARGALQTLTLGSAAEELLRAAPCAVLTIGPHAEIAPIPSNPGFHRILLATDFGPGSAKALPLALTWARARQAQLILLHVLPPLPAPAASLSSYAPAAGAADEVEEWEGTYRKRALAQLRACLPAETGLEKEPQFVVGTDFLTEGILAAGAKFNVDLIVMGANRRGSVKMAAHIPWTAVHEVLRHAHCPVMTVAA